MAKFSNFSFKDVMIHTKSVTSMNWSIDGTLLGTASNDKSFRVAHLEPQGGVKVIQTIASSSGSGTQFKWHPSEKQRFATAGDDVMIDLWDVRAQKPSSKLTSLGNNLHIAWSPNGQYLASGNRSDVLIVYDLIAGKQIHDIKFEHEINEYCWTCHSDYILTASGLGGIEVVHFDKSINELSKINFVPGHSSNCHQLNLYDPIDRLPGYREDALIALGGSDFQVTLWDVNDLICHTTICLESEVRGLGLSIDGNHVIVSTEEPNILFFSTSTGKQLAKADFKTSFRGLAWHPTANLIATASDERPMAGSNYAYLRFLSFNVTESSE